VPVVLIPVPAVEERILHPFTYACSLNTGLLNHPPNLILGPCSLLFILGNKLFGHQREVWSRCDG